MRHLKRPGLKLASALIASGLAFGVAPAVHADDGGAMVLSEDQTAKLAEHVQPDLNGDGTKPGTDQRDVAEQAVKDAPTEAESQGYEQGGDSGTTAGTSAVEPGSLKLTRHSAVEGAQGAAATAPVGGTSGDYFTVHSLGMVQRIGAGGKTLWKRDSLSLHDDWQDKPLRAYQKEPYPAAVAMGFNAVSPFAATSDNGWTTGDLTGDGVDDFVFTAKVGVLPYRPFSSPGSSLPNGTFVTVLDGASGKTLWNKLYAAAYNIKIVDKTLVVADSAYYNLNSPAGSKATLNGTRFSYANGKLTPTDTWTYDADAYTGVAWGSLEPLGHGLLAASWNQARQYTSDRTPSGHTLVIDTKDGGVKWKQTNRLYSRQLHLDAARGRIVALEQSDTTEGVSYAIASYGLADGKRTVLDTRINAVPTALEVGDVQGGSKPEYTVAESTVDADLSVTSTTVRALNGGDTAAPLWSRTIKDSDSADAGTVWGLRAVDGRIVANYVETKDTATAANAGANHYARLAVLDGGSGAVKWEKTGVVASQLYSQPFRASGHSWLRTVDTNQNVRVYNLGNGKQQSLTPIQGVTYAAKSMDLNGDKKKDLVVGGSSNGLFAYDGPSLVAGKPKLLWTAVLPGRVVQLTKADTTGDGRDEFVVAADSGAAVVDAATGKVLTTIDGGGQYVRNVVASDLDGDGAAEIAIGTDKLRAYQGDGSPMWTYSVPSEIGTPAFADLSAGDGKVYAQFQTRGGDPSAARATGQVAVNGKDGSVAWELTPKAAADTNGSVLGIPLRAGTYASPGIPYADGHAVVYTYVSRNRADQPYPGALGNWVQIRDGRTGKLLHESKAGGYATLANWYTGSEGLIGSSYPLLTTYAGGDQPARVYLGWDTWTSAPATGPDGEQLIAAGGQTYGILYDRSILTGGTDDPPAVTGYDKLGTRELFTGDLNGDGADEVVLLNYDEYGVDRTASLVGNTESLPYTAIRSMITLTIDKA
ncbi:hypothetical protein [Streptomyces sp. NPDC102360]|uniref:hypothetical protein n=1 Tax=Streptomyces sp. NPDC102360 TaxID=3366160 RepID=UPI0037F734E2